MKNDVILSVKDITITFHDHEESERVVDKFSLDLHEGEIVGLVGESGSGKSLSAMAIAGLLNRKDATITGRSFYAGLNFINADRKEIRKFQGNDIAVIFQDPMTSLDPVKKAGAQVEEEIRIHHPEIPKSERKKMALTMLESVGLKDVNKIYNSYPNELSGGMCQRVMIAGAMIGKPKILIADEPTTALDVTVQTQIVDLLREINKRENTSIIFISHDLSLVRKLARRAIVMQNGSIVEEGLCEDIFKAPKHEYTKKLIAAIPDVPYFGGDV